MNHQVSIEKDATNLQNKVDHDESSNCIKETNDEITDKNDSALNAEDLEVLLLGQSK